MEKLLKEALNTSKLNVLGQFGGYIAKEAAGYEIDGGKRIFVKCGVRIPTGRTYFILILLTLNTQQTKEIIEGEFASLQALQPTNTVRVPNPIQVSSNCPKFSVVTTKQTYSLPDSTTSRRQ